MLCSKIAPEGRIFGLSVAPESVEYPPVVSSLQSLGTKRAGALSIYRRAIWNGGINYVERAVRCCRDVCVLFCATEFFVRRNTQRSPSRRPCGLNLLWRRAAPLSGGIVGELSGHGEIP